MKMYWGSGGIAPRISNFRTRWSWVVRFRLRTLYPLGKNSRYPFDRRLDGPKNQSGCGGEEKSLYMRRWRFKSRSSVMWRRVVLW